MFVCALSRQSSAFHSAWCLASVFFVCVFVYTSNVESCDNVVENRSISVWLSFARTRTLTQTPHTQHTSRRNWIISNVKSQCRLNVTGREMDQVLTDTLSLSTTPLFISGLMLFNCVCLCVLQKLCHALPVGAHIDEVRKWQRSKGASDCWWNYTLPPCEIWDTSSVPNIAQICFAI